MRVEASAPSNIALIKYMGKTETAVNKPANPSLSYTLDALRTFVTLEEGPSEWHALDGKLQLSEKGRAKFLAHLARLQDAWRIEGTFTVRSANDFPSDCGLASSASSFAALTEAAYRLKRAQDPAFHLTREALSGFSRLGSGSSCRSFFTPWAAWATDTAEAVALDLRLDHAVVIVEDTVKSVSSSEAHVRVTSSALYRGRPERAAERLSQLTQALRTNAWREAFELCWAEFWDMHALFETSRPSFGYMTEGTLRTLARLREVWRREGDGPLVTMDAGPNVHVLLRQDQTERADAWLSGLNAIKSWERA